MKKSAKSKKKARSRNSRQDLGARTLKLVLEYDGTGYSGFQSQPGKVTIQSVLEKALSRLFAAPAKIAAASGRTDAGVHAAHQVVSLKTDSVLPLRRIQSGLNYYLPRDIAVISVEEAPAGFHARFQAKSKAYEYRIWNHRVRSPLRAARSYHVPFELDLKAMKKAAALLTGRHDFGAFCSSGSGRSDTVRTIKKLTLQTSEHDLLLRVEADGFLYHMVRHLAGTLVEVGRGKLAPLEMKRFLEAGTKRKSPFNAPAHALSLVSVTY